jgi:drug/metabolite transporter (DMT)-like permease
MKYLGALLCLALVWGSSFLFTAVAVRDFQGLHVVVLRQGLGALIVGSLVWLNGLRMPRGWRPWAVFGIMGMLNAGIPQIFLGWGLRHIDSSLAAILFASTPLWSAILGQRFLSDEYLSPLGVVGLLIGFLGVAVVLGAGNDLRFSSWQAILGMAGFVFSAFLSAASGIFARRVFLLRDINPLVGATGQLAATSVFLAPAVLLVGLPERTPGLPAIGAVLGLALFSTSVGFVLYYWLLRAWGATRTMTVTYLMPIVALVWGALLLGERVTIGSLLGLAMVLFGIALTSRRPTPTRVGVEARQIS